MTVVAGRAGPDGPSAAPHEAPGRRRQAQAYLPLHSVGPNDTASGMVTVTRQAGQCAAGAEITVPHTTRELPVRVVCEQLPSPQWHLGRRHVADPVCLAIGKPGRDPGLVSSPGERILIITTRLTLTPGGDGTFDITGPYVEGSRDNRTLTLRWGTCTAAGHFLLFSGAQLRLPRIAALPATRPRGAPAPALILRLAMTDVQGELLCGVIAAGDLAWQVTSRQLLPRRAATADPIREAVIASNA